jgi:putative transposase
MRRSRFSEEQIIGILWEEEAGTKVADVCRKHEISDATFYAWKAKYGGLEVSEASRLKALEDENRRLKIVERNMHERRPCAYAEAIAALRGRCLNVDSSRRGK